VAYPILDVFRGIGRANQYTTKHPFSSYWGDSASSSSDGQNFKIGGRVQFSGQVNLKYGQEPGMQFYTHISDQYFPFHIKVINVTVRDSTHLLDYFLYNESDLHIDDHYTGMASFTGEHAKPGEALRTADVIGL